MAKQKTNQFAEKSEKTRISTADLARREREEFANRESSAANFYKRGRRRFAFKTGKIGAVEMGGIAAGATAVGAVAFGALALGAVGVGVFVIGRLAIKGLAVDRASFRKVEIDVLEVRELRVKDLTVTNALRTPGASEISVE